MAPSDQPPIGRLVTLIERDQKIRKTANPDPGAQHMERVREEIGPSQIDTARGMGQGKLRCQSQQGECDKNCAAQPAPRAPCQQADEESASKDDEVRTGEIGTRDVAPRRLQCSDQRRGVKREGADREEGERESAETEEMVTIPADLYAVSGKLRLQRPQQQKQESKTAEGEGLRDQDQAAQDDGQKTKDIEEQGQGGRLSDGEGNIAACHG